MTAINRYRSPETESWEQTLPTDESLIALGLREKSPFPIISLMQSPMDHERLLKMLSQGANLHLQRRAWSIVAVEAARQGFTPSWLCRGFDEAITRICFPNLLFSLVSNELKWQLNYGRSLTADQVLTAWAQQDKLWRASYQIALHHLWLESHPQRDSFTPEMLGEGQILMMALSDPSPHWKNHLPADAREAMLSIDLGL